MFNTPVKMSRPNKIFDGEDITIDRGDPAASSSKVAYCDPVIDADGQIQLQVPEQLDVKVGDIIEIPLNKVRLP